MLGTLVSNVGQAKDTPTKAKGRDQEDSFERYVLELAQELGMVGWVGRDPHDYILLMAEGPPEALEAFLEELKKAPPTQAKWLEAEVLEALKKAVRELSEEKG